MDFNQLVQQLGVFLPVVAIILGLFLAWVVARIGAYIVRRVFESLKVDERASSSLDAKTQITKWASGVIFWVLFVFVLWQLATLAGRFIGIPASTVDPRDREHAGPGRDRGGEEAPGTRSHPTGLESHPGGRQRRRHGS